MANITILVLMLGAEIPAIVVLSGMNFLSMSLWATAAFFFSSFCYSFNLDYMGRDILPETVMVIQGALLAIYLGEYIGRKSKIRFWRIERYDFQLSSNYVAQYAGIYRSIIAGKKATFILCGLFLAYSAYYFRIVYQGAASVYANINPVMAIAASRGLAQQRIITMDWGVNILLYCVISFSYVYLFYFIYNSIICSKRKYFLLLPVVVSFVAITISSSRSNALPIFFIAICLTYLMLRRKQISIAPVLYKFLKILAFSFGFLALFFFAFGRLIRNQQWTFYELFMKYFVSSIYGLDEYLRYPWDPMPIWGLATFRDLLRQVDKIYSLGYDFSAPLGEGVKHFFRYSQGTMTSNISTALTGGLHDLGLGGMLCFWFVVAFIYGMLDRYVQSRHDISRHVYAEIMLGWLLQVAFLLPVANRFTVLLSPSFIWMSLFIFIGNWFYRISTRKIRLRL